MKRTRSIRVTALILAVSLTASGCAGNVGAGTQNQEGSQEKTEIVFAHQTDITSLDPHEGQDNVSGILYSHIYSTLVKLNNDGEVVGNLAESWEMEGDREYIFHLNENAVFSDGTPVTAQDVKFTFDRAMSMPKMVSQTSRISEVIVENEHQVRFRLSEPYASFLTIMCIAKMCVLSEAAVTSAGENYGSVETILGSGPFVLEEWVPNDHYTMIRNENYWGEMPKATSITCRVIPEGAARTIALETGEIDLIWTVDSIDVPNLEANPEVVCEKQPSTSIEYLAMNTKREPFSDERVRQAISYALDKQAFVDTILEGYGEVANSVMNRQLFGWNEELEPYPYDVEKAKALLKEAGYPNGFSCSIYVSGDVRNRSAQLVQAQLAEVGIQAEIFLYEWGAFLDAVNAGEHDLVISGLGNSTVDPDNNVQYFLSSNQGAGGNRAFLSDPEADEMILAASRELDDEKRAEIYKELQVKLKDLAPWVPLYYSQNIVARRADLKGLELHKGGTYYLGNLHYEK